MAWIVLFAAGVFEVVWAFAMKRSDGFTRLPESIVTVVAMVASVVLLGWAMRVLPLGTAYAVWTGIGAVGSFLLGIWVLGEAATAGRLIAAAMIVGGLVLMKMSSSA
jgi:quaternary ammonium compound-resistance protein SugE